MQRMRSRGSERRTVWAVSRPTADRVPALLFRAFKEAKDLDHGWVGPEHLLLALLARPSVATDVLAALGMTYDGLAEYLRTRGDPDCLDPR